MKQSFFNRLLHLLNERPQQGKRMVGLGADALWELWQRIAEVEREERSRSGSTSWTETASWGRTQEGCRRSMTET